MVTVAITGVGGLLGRRLVGRLDDVPAVERTVGLDVAAPAGLASPKLEFHQADVRDPKLGRLLQGVDVLVHLAYQMDPIVDEDTMWAINVDGTRNTLSAAAEAGVGKIVYPSSVVAYGAHPDNDFPLTEDSPIRANPDFNYSHHKGEVERWLHPWAQRHPELTVTVLRLGMVAGPGIDNAWTRLLFEQPRFTTIRGHRPPLQLAHLEDVLDAFELAVDRDLPGAYNVASEGWLSFDEFLAVSGQHLVEVPEELAFSAVDQLWRLGQFPGPPGMTHFVMYPWVMSVDRLVQEGWRPRHTNRDALAELAREHRGYVVLGNTRVRKRRLGIGAGVAAGTVALGAALWARRRTAG